MADIDRILLDLTSQMQNYHVGEQGLSFYGRALKLNDEKDAYVITDEIDKSSNLEFLNLDGNTIGVLAAKKIAESLSNHGEFKRAIWKNMFTGRTKEEIPDALNYLGSGVIEAMANLVELDLSDNAFGPIGVEGLSVLLHSPSCYTLENLRLNNNGLGITGGKLLAKVLQECYEGSNKKFALRVFQAGRNRLENVGSKALAKVFQAIGTLVEISMPQNGIYFPGISALSEAFKNNPHLKVINLNDNTVLKKGAAALSEALPVLQNLETLNLGDCLLKTAGALLIAKALASKHQNLRTLILDHNEIRIEGGMEIARAVQNKNSLLTLNLNGNGFGEHGISEIQEELRKNDRIFALQDFSDDEGSDEENEDEINDDCNEDYVETEESCSSDEGNKSQPATSCENNFKRKVTIAEFLNVSSSGNFLELGSNQFELIKKFLETSESENFLKNTLIMLLAVSNLCDNNQETVKTQAISCALQIYKYLFDWATKRDQISLVTNAILVQLRLIKAEEKQSLVDCNLNTCINVLQTAMDDADAVPSYCKNMISIFLQKRKPQENQ